MAALDGRAPRDPHQTSRATTQPEPVSPAMLIPVVRRVEPTPKSVEPPKTTDGCHSVHPPWPIGFRLRGSLWHHEDGDGDHCRSYRAVTSGVQASERLRTLEQNKDWDASTRTYQPRPEHSREVLRLESEERIAMRRIEVEGKTTRPHRLPKGESSNPEGAETDAREIPRVLRSHVQRVRRRVDPIRVK
ncbi:hypothetical protein HPB47_011188, partial [Ixodes persulcatus]